jgi:hypothetical protein
MWHRLPPVPDGCGTLADGQKPAFLDNRLVYWCPHAKAGPVAGHDGLMHTLTPAATPTPRQRPLSLLTLC